MDPTSESFRNVAVLDQDFGRGVYEQSQHYWWKSFFQKRGNDFKQNDSPAESSRILRVVLAKSS